MILYLAKSVAVVVHKINLRHYFVEIEMTYCLARKCDHFLLKCEI